MGWCEFLFDGLKAWEAAAFTIDCFIVIFGSKLLVATLRCGILGLLDCNLLSIILLLLVIDYDCCTSICIDNSFTFRFFLSLLGPFFDSFFDSFWKSVVVSCCSSFRSFLESLSDIMRCLGSKKFPLDELLFIGILALMSIIWLSRVLSVLPIKV